MKKVLVIVVMLFTVSLFATEYTLLVAPKKSAAYKNAKKMANDKTIFAHRKLFKALNQATEIINKGKADTINIKVAHGEYKGKGKTGHWYLEDIKNINATLRILGGYDDNFKVRAPFDTTSQLIVSETRNQPVFQLEGRKNALKEFWFSGFVIDVAPGNKYDAKTNSLLKGKSCTHNILAFGYLKTFKFVLSDNVLMNGAHMAAAPRIRPAGPKAYVIIMNNFIVNNVLAWKVDAAGYKDALSDYILQNNSFILNWPYNADPTSSNVAALEVDSKSRLKDVKIIGNIFAFNNGGAIMPMWKEKRMPKMTISSNLFSGNGALFNEKAYDAALVGKFNGAATYSSYTIEDMEDDFSWKIEKNGTGNPKIDIKIAKLIAGNSHDVKVKNTKMNNYRELLGQNKRGTNMKIGNYAPRLELNIKSFFPSEKKLKHVGVRKDLVKQF